MENKKWMTVIKPKSGWRDIDLKELWRYRDLIYLFVKRNFATMYKQTVLGPAWIIITPLFSTLVSTFVFGGIAKIPTDGVPYFLFYMCGNVAWNYFATCLTNTSSTFVSNAHVFGKVYFPRLVAPISTVITGLMNFVIQLFMFIVFAVWHLLAGGSSIFGEGMIHPNFWIFALPLLVLQMALLGLGCGIIISSLTTKYRDLTVLVGFGVSLWMYITPIIYSTTSITNENIKFLCRLNPMTPVAEVMRKAFLGTGEIDPLSWGISIAVTAVVLFVGVVLFNRVEKTFMDTV